MRPIRFKVSVVPCARARGARCPCTQHVDNKVNLTGHEKIEIDDTCFEVTSPRDEIAPDLNTFTSAHIPW